MASPGAQPMQWDQASYHNQYDFPLTNSYNEAEHFAAQGMPPPGMGYGDQSMESMATTRSRKLSSQGRKALNWIKGKRSNSPMANSHDQQQPPSPSSFVVRTVSRSPGGVSQDSYMDASYNQPYSQPYQTQRSQPIAQPMSLGVPPGGPGGGTGYGTAMSSNDGRPEETPFSHYQSGGLQRQSSQSSQRSGRFDRARSASPTRPSSPGAIKAGAFHAPSRVSPGPLSNRQRDERDDIRSQKSFEQMREATLQRRVSAQSLWRQHHPEQQQKREQEEEEERRRRMEEEVEYQRQMEEEQRRQAERQQPSRKPVSQAFVPFPGNMSSGQLSTSQSNPQRFSMPVHIPHGSGPPSVIPIDDAHPAMRNHPSPLGAVSPMPSPLPHDRERYDSSASQSPATTATKWFKGIFGRSPRHDEREDYMYRDMPWASSGGDNFPQQRKSSQRRHSTMNDGSPIASRRYNDPAEAEAEARKRQSMMMAAKIEDEHRNRLINGESTQDEHRHRQERSQLPAAPTPQSVLRQQGRKSDRANTTEDTWDPPRSRSPPGRKPAPQVSDGLSALESHLTPAQQIIAETRSKIRQQERRNSDLPQPPREQSWMNSNADAKGKERAATAVVKPQTDKPAAKPRKSANMKPGEGPMPNDMPLPEAMQEMMARFYRFERYVIPLVRSLESRVGDIERDNEQARSQDGAHGGQRDRDMEKWVSQMTTMMKSEMGQLQIAARDIRKAREALTTAAEEHAAAMSAQAAESKALTEAAQGLSAPKAASMTSASNNEPARIGREESTQREASEPRAEAEVQRSQVSTSNDEVHEMPEPKRRAEAAKDEDRKKSNFSSASFQSALPSRLPQEKESSIDRSTANASPNGRPRYTKALGQPLHDGKMSPQASPSQEKSFALPPLEIEKSSEKKATSKDDSAPSIATTRKNTLSIDERLRGLVSRSASAASHERQTSNPSERIDSTHGREGSDEKAGSASRPASYAARADSLLPEKLSFPRATSPMSLKAPSPLIPQTTGESIRTSNNASNNLRARAQSYLQHTTSATSSPSAQSPSSNSNSPGLASKPFGGVRTPLFQSSASPAASGHSAARRSLSGSSVLKATGILGARDLNAGGAFGGSGLAGSRAFSKGASASPSPPPTKSILDSLPSAKTGNSIRKESLKSPSTATPPPNPQRMSIRDRVAFFDAQMG